MTSFNDEKNIENAIESILEQTYKDFEFLICDFKQENSKSYKTDTTDYNNYLADALNQDFGNFYKNFEMVRFSEITQTFCKITQNF